TRGTTSCPALTSRRVISHALYAAIPPLTPSRTRRFPAPASAKPTPSLLGGSVEPTPLTEVDLLLGVRVDDLALGSLLEGHRQVVLRARLDQRRRKLVERPLTELVVVVVDLPRALGGDDHECV